MAASLTFPRSTFAKLSPHPFLIANLVPSSDDVAPARTNGRAPEQARPPNVNTSSLSHAHGSSIVRVGDTTVICGVRGEILPVTNIPQWRPKSKLDIPSTEGDREEGARELKDYDLLVPNIELATGCAPQFLPGGPPTPLAQTLSTRVYSLLHTSGLLKVDDLRIWYTPPKLEADDDDRMEDADAEDNDAVQPEVKAYWTLYIDVLFISFDGNPFDAAWAAILAALRDTKLPRAWWDADREMILCSRTDKKALSVHGLPIACSAVILKEKNQQENAAQGKSWLLVDPDNLEESLCDETITVVVDRTSGKTTLRAISKGGGVIIDPQQMRHFTAIAEARWEEFKKAME